MDSVALTPGQDLGELYSSLSVQLERIVRLGVSAPDVVIEDACQFAWGRLVRHAERVRREAVLSWLVRTAMREAVRAVRRGSRELSLEMELIEQLAGEAPDPHELFTARERLGAVASLPPRQQRLVWLHAVGLSYAEMAQHERCTRRTVERQLLRAKRSVRAAADR